MKGYITISAPPPKRRWKVVALAVVLALVVFSMLVPLAFLLGLHNRFPYGSSGDDRSSPGSKIDDLMKKLGPTLVKEGLESFRTQPDGLVSSSDAQSSSNILPSTPQPKAQSRSENGTLSINDVPTPQFGSAHPTPDSRNNIDGKRNPTKGPSSDETEKPCQLEFGSYCLWSLEHKEAMKDSKVKILKDQLFVARSYYPSIAKLKRQDKLSRELKQNIQEHERMLSEAISDADLPQLVEKKMQKMDQTIERAKACVVDCHNVDKKLRQILDLTEDEAHFHMKQSAFLYHLGVQTMPKSLHCLSMRLTVENFKSAPVGTEDSYGHKHDNSSLQHYAIFSRNVLATSVAINSTVMNSVVAGKMVFHVLTDRQNYYAMKLWFARNSYKKATIFVENIVDTYLKEPPELLGSDEFRISIRSSDQPSPLHISTQYMSVFGSSHFLLPRIFKNLKRVVVLDDDVVVQRDLSPLWDLDMEGKVNGAVTFCKVKFGQLKSYLGSHDYDSNSCAWLSGLNVVDLEKWREHDVTRVYQQLLKKLGSGSGDLLRAAALPASLLAFHNLTYALDDSWVLSGLGHNYGLKVDMLKHSGVLHYNGNMKPWLELGIPKYKKYWKKFLTKDERFMDECNVNP